MFNSEVSISVLRNLPFGDKVKFCQASKHDLTKECPSQEVLCACGVLVLRRKELSVYYKADCLGGGLLLQVDFIWVLFCFDYPSIGRMLPYL